jgi:hypothetical protein
VVLSDIDSLPLKTPDPLVVDPDGREKKGKAINA